MDYQCILKWICILVTAFLTTFLLIDPAVAKLIPYIFEKRVPVNEVNSAFNMWLKELDVVLAN